MPHQQVNCMMEVMMVTKRVSPADKPATLKPKAAAAPKRTAKAAAVVPQSANSIDAENRRQLIAAEAYFLAERRGFAAGHEVEDWIAAEAAVNSRLEQRRVA